jgi:hypothetical protein
VASKEKKIEATKEKKITTTNKFIAASKKWTTEFLFASKEFAQIWAPSPEILVGRSDMRYYALGCA